MKQVIFIFFFTALLVSLYSQTAWQRIPVNFSYDLADIQFINDNTGFIAAGRNFAPGSVFKTTDGGQSWVCIFLTSKPMKSICFNSATTGTVVGQFANVRRTYTGGEAWYWFAPPMGQKSINAVHFIDEQTGWVGGDSGYVYRTNDYGATWKNTSPGPNNIIWNDVYFMDFNTGIAAGESNSGGSIYRTANHGNNWEEVNSITGSWKRISFCGSTGFIAGSGNNIGLLKTTDSGINWDNSGNSNEYNDVFCVNNTVYAVGSGGVIHKSPDMGVEWIVLNSGTQEDLYAVYFVDPLTGWVCGDNGVILKTTTGGIIPIGIINTGTEIPVKFSLEQNYPNPFNPITRFGLRIAEPGLVKLTIYNAAGKEITALINENLNPGTYEVTWDASNYPSGTYFYRLHTGDYAETKKMILLK